MPATICDDVNELELERLFDRATYARGRAYQREGRVIGCDVSNDGHTVTAAVEGNERAPYRVKAIVSHSKRYSTLLIQGTCTCPMQFNCKHVVAALAEALAMRRNGTSGEASVRRDPRVEPWLASVGEALAPKETCPEAIVYFLEPQGSQRRLAIGLHAVRWKPDGSWFAPRTYPIQSIIFNQARKVTAADMQVARLLQSLSPTNVRYDNDMLDEALRVVLQTGRAYWRGIESPIHPGPNRRGELRWTARNDQKQRLEAIVDGIPVETVLTNRAWGLDKDHREIFELEFDHDPRLVAALLAGPSIGEPDIPSVIARLAPLGVPLPASTVAVHLIAEPPVPHLSIEVVETPMYSWGGPTHDIPGALLSFAYGDARVTRESEEIEWRSTGNDGVTVRRRDATAEAGAYKELERRGLRVPPNTYGVRPLQPTRAKPRFWVDFLLNDVPELQRQGWIVDVAADFPHQVVASDEPWQITANGIDEITLDVSLLVEGKRVPLVPLLSEAIWSGALDASSERIMLGPLDDGKMLSLPAERLRRLVAVLIDVFDRPEVFPSKVTIPFSRALGLETLEGGVHLDGQAAGRVRDASKELAAKGARLPAVPKTLRATLRPYQHEGFAWLQRLRNVRFGGILADSMGLGKTVQTLAHLLAERKRGRLDRPALVIAPTSLLPNWEAEARRFAPSLKTVVLHGPTRSERHTELDDAHLVVTSYALLLRDATLLTSRDWSVAVLDEAQNVKNAASKTAKAARMLRADQRLCLTGTPIENHLEELWSLFAFVDPAILGERERFRRIFRTPIEKHGDVERRRALASRVAPFILRRTKESVASDLPAKTEILTRVEFGERQRDLYETIRAAVHKRVQEAIASRGLARSQIVVLDALLKLRQVCCHPRLLPVERTRGVDESAKLEALREMVEEMVDDGRRILLFSQFTSMLRLIEEQLRDLGIAYVQLTGATVDRAAPVKRFQSGEVPVFLISLKAGGTGLNLTAADTVIHYDPWWNPAVENQATDRAHRIGQDKPIFVYKLVCQDSIEERILELQARKGAVASALLDEAGTAIPLDADEITRLFEGSTAR